jgi:tetratricopeptide (TPR) repeat protein
MAIGVIGVRWPHPLMCLVDGLLCAAACVFLSWVAWIDTPSDPRGSLQLWCGAAAAAVMAGVATWQYHSVRRARGSRSGVGASVAVAGIGLGGAAFLILAPGDYTRLIDRGNEHLARKQYREAIAVYSEAIQADPRRSEAYFNRGTARQVTGDFSGALADLSIAIELEPDMVEAYINRGRCRFELKDLDGAVADFSRVIELAPNNAEGYHLRGLTKCEQGKSDAGRRDLEICWKLRPELRAEDEKQLKSGR